MRSMINLRDPPRRAADWNPRSPPRQLLGFRVLGRPVRSAPPALLRLLDEAGSAFHRLHGLRLGILRPLQFLRCLDAEVMANAPDVDEFAVLEQYEAARLDGLGADGTSWVGPGSLRGWDHN